MSSDGWFRTRCKVRAEKSLCSLKWRLNWRILRSRNPWDFLTAEVGELRGCFKFSYIQARFWQFLSLLQNAYTGHLVWFASSRLGFPTIIYIFTKLSRHYRMETRWFRFEGCLTDLWNIFEQYLRKAVKGVKNRTGIPEFLSFGSFSGQPLSTYIFCRCLYDFRFRNTKRFLQFLCCITAKGCTSSLPRRDSLLHHFSSQPKDLVWMDDEVDLILKYQLKLEHHSTCSLNYGMATSSQSAEL